MERVLLICLQTALFIFTCSVMSETLDKVTPLMEYPWKSDFKKKIFRQGPSEEVEDTRQVEKTEVPPARDCVCSKIYDPVCASNNESYYNLCLLECKVAQDENVTIVHQGNCIPF